MIFVCFIIFLFAPPDDEDDDEAPHPEPVQSSGLQGGLDQDLVLSVLIHSWGSDPLVLLHHSGTRTFRPTESN